MTSNPNRYLRIPSLVRRIGIRILPKLHAQESASVNRVEWILTVVPMDCNSPVKLILPRMLPLKRDSAVIPSDFDFGNGTVKAMLLGRASSRRWRSKGHCTAWPSASEWTQWICEDCSRFVTQRNGESMKRPTTRRAMSRRRVPHPRLSIARNIHIFRGGSGQTSVTRTRWPQFTSPEYDRFQPVTNL